MQHRFIYFMRLIISKPHIDGLHTLRANKPQLLCELWGHEGMHHLYVNPRDIFTIHLSLKVQKTWPSLKATNLAQKTTISNAVRGM
jgi:hypothetical protein